MSDRQPPTGREDAVQRLYAAVDEQVRLRRERDDAADTHLDASAEASLRAADDVVLARERWLKAVDDNDY